MPEDKTGQGKNQPEKTSKAGSSEFDEMEDVYQDIETEPKEPASKKTKSATSEESETEETEETEETSEETEETEEEEETEEGETGKKEKGKPEVETIWDKDIEIENGKKEKAKLTLVSFDDGSVGYLPDAHIKDLMLHKDYTKKSMELADTKRSIEAREKITLDKDKNAEARITPYQYALIARDIGAHVDDTGNFNVKDYGEPEPKKEDYVTSTDSAERMEQMENYRDDHGKWEKNRDNFERRKGIYFSNVKRASDENIKNMDEFDAFVKKYYPNMDVTAEVLLYEMEKFVSSSITRGQMPFHKDTLKIFFYGTRFKDILEKKFKPSIRAQVLKEIEKESDKGKGLPKKIPGKTKVTTKSTSKSFEGDPIYDAVDELSGGTW